MILLVSVAGGLILQVVISEVQNLVNGVPAYAPRIVASLNDLLDLIPGGRDLVADFDVTSQLSGLVSRLFSVFSQALLVFQYVLNLFSGLLDVLMILLLALYITTDGPRIGRYLRAFLPPTATSRPPAPPAASSSAWAAGSAASCSSASSSACSPGSA